MQPNYNSVPMWKTKTNLSPIPECLSKQALSNLQNAFALTQLSADKYSLSFVSQPFFNLPDTIGAKVFR